MEKSFKQKYSGMADEAKWLNRIFRDSQEWYDTRGKKEKQNPVHYIRLAIKKHCLPKPRGYTDDPN